MKKVGLIGGLSWHSTQQYYEIINKIVAERLGGLHSARLIIESLDLAKVAKLQEKEKWQDVLEIIGTAGYNLEHAEAEAIAICSNTPHKIADELIENYLDVPLLHIADAVVWKMKQKKLGSKSTLLLGTKHTMAENGFYFKKLKEQNINVVVPLEEKHERINDIIFKELCKNMIYHDSKNYIRNLIRCLSEEKEIRSVILACTELSMVVNPNDRNIGIPVIDSLECHAKYIAEFMLS